MGVSFTQEAKVIVTGCYATRRPEEFRQQHGGEQESVSGKIELKLQPYALARVDIG